MGITVTFRDDFVVLQDYEGDVVLDDILESINYTIERASKEEKYRYTLVDMLGCELKINPEDISAIFGLLEKNKDRYVSERVAIVADNPKNTALSMLFEDDSDMYLCEVFSTRSAAESWIKK